MKHLFPIFFFTAIHLHAQMLINTDGILFGDHPAFNEQFILQHKIHSFRGYYSTKAELDIIRPSNESCYYEFNKAGQLIREYHTRFGDTLFSSFEYDYKSRLLKMRKADQYGYHWYSYHYDDKDRITEREYRLDRSKKGGRYSFDPDETCRQSKENYEYIDYDDRTYKKNYINGVGKIYREELVYLDETGRMDHSTSRTMTGAARTETKRLFDKKGHLTEVTSYVKLMEENTTVSKFEYDKEGNLLAEHVYKNEEYLTEKQLVYEVGTSILQAIVTRKAATNFMTIVKFGDYSFF